MKKFPAAILALVTAICASNCIAQGDNERAESALTRYFSYLNAGRYEEAVDLYGGGYDVLADWNPNIDPNDYAKLFEMGCTTNGLQCLRVQNIEAIEHSTPGIFEIYIQFENRDGSLFVLESMDTLTSAPRSKSMFKYTVALREGAFVVQELPLYLP